MQNRFKELSQNWKTHSSLAQSHWHGSFPEYLTKLKETPAIARNAYQRMYDMILSAGVEEYTLLKQKMLRYKFFDDAQNNGADAVFGLDSQIMQLMNVFKAAALGYGTEKRVILLHGPVGSAKSTICRLLKKGLENYSRTEKGALYTFEWVNEQGELDELLGVGVKTLTSPMHEEPLLLIPEDLRHQVINEINLEQKGNFKLSVKGELCPPSRFIFQALMEKYDNDIEKVLSHVRVKRLFLSEANRVGIGTFQPKDEKNQDSTELTGDINYRKIAEYGTDSDPRAFNFDGEFCVANRGMIEFVEVLKLDVAFLYDLLGASQEHRIKPKKFAQTSIDEVIIGHTNEPEFRRLEENEFMEALRDRTVRIDIPYITNFKHEVSIYKKDFNKNKVQGISIAPHTVEMAAMWAILTRLEKPTQANLTRMQKLKLYSGRSIPGYTEENIQELQNQTTREGFMGISPRYIQDKLSNTLILASQGSNSVNPFMVLKELSDGLKKHSLLNSDEMKEEYRTLIKEVQHEYEEIIKGEVQRAISADENALIRLCANYIDNIKAYTQKEKIINSYTHQPEEPNERMMRSIEEKIEIPESRKDDFRREVMNFIGALAVDGKKFDYKTNERLYKALEMKLFDDAKDSIQLTNIVSNIVDKSTQEKIDIVKQRLIQNYGYDEVSATAVLNHVASIYARGDQKGDE